jgi:CRP-like cAMP-binding protein
MDTIEALLHDVPLFEGLTPAEFELIAGCGSNVRFREGELLFRDGNEADTFFIVRHGAVALETFVPTRGAVTIETLEAGEVVGWSWLFPPHRWHFDARALSLVRATGFDGACLRAKCEADPRLGYDLMLRFAQIVIERLQQTRLRLLDVYGYAGAD